MKVLVVGLGSIGTRHINNLFRLGIEDLSVFRSRKLNPPAELLPKNIKYFYDYEEALKNKPDAVIIANPTSLHLSYALKALKRDCHLYLEKPVSNTLRSTKKLLKLKNKKNLVGLVGCQHRFDPNFIDIKQWIDNGEIGKIYSVQVDMGEYLPSWHPWEDYRTSYASRVEYGGGVILTLIHEIDYLYWLFGPVGYVFASGGHLTSLEIDVEDTALITMITKSGISIQLRMDYWRKPPVRKMHIVGERGEIFWDYYKGVAELINNNTIINKSIRPGNWERNDLFLAIMDNFLKSIKGDCKVCIPLEEGVDVLRIALCAKKSILKKKVIKI